MKLSLVALLLVAARAGSAQIPVPSPAATDLARRVAGCYRLDDGPWRADSVRAGDVSTKHTPLDFELTDQQIHDYEWMQTSDRPAFDVRTLDGPWSYWRRRIANQDSILISYPLPLAGVDLILTPAGRDLSGMVLVFTDGPIRGRPTRARRPVYARRGVCPPGLWNGRDSLAPPGAKPAPD
jgi:hypothetical protein